MVVLLVNDDGYRAEGIVVLERVLLAYGHDVWVCAPSSQRSAQSHAMTIKGDVKLTRYGQRHFHCSGTPADCVLYGLQAGSLPSRIDVVVSGINHGYNASTDILYSGTVGAARESALRGIPSIAISARADRSSGVFPFESAARFLAGHLEQFLPLCSPDVVLNINVPPGATGTWKPGCIGRLEYFDVVERKADASGASFDASSTQIGLAYGDLEVGGEISFSLRDNVHPQSLNPSDEEDFQILSEGHVSVTPLMVHPCVHEEAMRRLRFLREETLH